MLKEYQLHKIRGTITIDLQEVRLDRPIHATVVVHLIGDAMGMKEGGVLSQGIREVTVEALPMEVPAHLEFDVSGLQVNDTARLDQLILPEGVTLLDDLETVLAGVSPPAQEEEPQTMMDGVPETPSPRKPAPARQASRLQSPTQPRTSSASGRGCGGLSGERLVVRGKDAGSPDSGFYRGD